MVWLCCDGFAGYGPLSFLLLCGYMQRGFVGAGINGMRNIRIDTRGLLRRLYLNDEYGAILFWHACVPL